MQRNWENHRFGDWPYICCNFIIIFLQVQKSNLILLYLDDLPKSCSLMLIIFLISFNDLVSCMQQKASSLVFVRSERLGRKYVLYSQSFELVVFAFIYSVSHSAQMSLSITALEKHLCPQGWPPGRLGSLRVWRNGYWLSSIGKQNKFTELLLISLKVLAPPALQ